MREYAIVLDKHGYGGCQLVLLLAEEIIIFGIERFIVLLMQHFGGKGVS